MKNINRLLLCLLTALAIIQPAQAQTPIPFDEPAAKPTAEKSPATTDGIIVKFEEPAQLPPSDSPVPQVYGALAMDRMSAAAGVPLTLERPMSGGAYVVRLPEAVPQAEAQIMANEIEQLPMVEYASPVIHMKAMQVMPELTTDAGAVPNDPDYSKQWHYFAPTSGNYGINLPAAWNITTGSASVVVAVLDTGILFSHPDLTGRTLAGYDMISSVEVANDGNARDPDPSDPGDAAACSIYPFQPSSWHGTHVAGTIGAASNNGVGVAGANWTSKLLPVRVLGKCGNGDPDIIDAVRWAAGMSVFGVPDNPTPAKVINLSLGGSGDCTAAWQSAIDDVIAMGVVVVVAAGNSNADAQFATPANCKGVIAVGATERDGTRASYSNFGSIVALSAPGGTCTSSCNLTDVDGVLSTYNAGITSPGANTYNYLDGTSMATPHVAGVASLMLSINSQLTPAQVLNILKNTATTFPGGACDTNTAKTCGAGIVNAGAAVALAKGLLNVTPRLFLPALAQQATLTAIANGDFESGPVDWQASSTANPADVLIYQKGISPFPTGLTPHSGNWVAWMGGYPAGLAENALLSQGVTVPDSKPYLIYYQVGYGGETNCASDYVRVLVNDTEMAGSRTGVCNSITYGPWVRRSLNLSAYAGQSVTLAFNFRADASSNTPVSSVFIDDVSFSATP